MQHARNSLSIILPLSSIYTGRDIGKGLILFYPPSYWIENIKKCEGEDGNKVILNISIHTLTSCPRRFLLNSMNWTVLMVCIHFLYASCIFTLFIMLHEYYVLGAVSVKGKNPFKSRTISENLFVKNVNPGQMKFFHFSKDIIIACRREIS